MRRRRPVYLAANRSTPRRVKLRSVISSKTSAMPPTTPSISDFRLALGQFATGVTVVTAECGPGQVHGMTANAFTSVSLDPLLILICVSQSAQMLPLVNRHKRFGVNILKDSQQAISEYFAQTEEDAARESNLGIRYRWTPSGIPLLDDALAHLACNVVASYIAGDHTIFIAEVESLELLDGQPLLYLRGDYRRLNGR
jgi:flavin reductase (DIM6/NTAB) family NADH-FMN oxidoreductase RutF